MSKTMDRMVWERAIALIEKGWAKYTYARDAKGNEVNMFDTSAVKFCAEGAVMRAARDVFGNDCLEERFFERFDGDPSLVTMNDRGCKAAVLKLFRAHAEAC